MAGHEIIRHKPQRLSRKRIREWLEAEGPQPLKTVVVQAKLQLPGIAKEQVLAELQANPELFEETENGLWAARPRQRYVVVDAKPRPRPVTRKKRPPEPLAAKHPPRSADRRSRDRHYPKQGEPVTVEKGRLVCLTFSRLVPGAGEPLESGRHLLVPLPQVADRVSPAVLESILVACSNTEATDVYEWRPRVGAVYRGRRRILHTRRSPDGTRVHVVLGPGEGDEGHTFGLLRGAPALPLLPRGSEGDAAPTPADAKAGEPVAVYEGGTALAPLALRRAIIESAPLSDEARRAAMLPAPRHRYDRKRAFEDANRQLNAVRIDRSKWPAFHEWLARRKGEYDQELLQDILERALNLEEVDPIDVFRLARVLIEEDASIRPGFAYAYCTRLSERLADEEAIRWAKELLPIALERNRNDSDVELDLASARIATYESRHADACRGYHRAFSSEPPPTKPSDLEEYVFAAAAGGDRAEGRAALERLEETVARCVSPSQLAQLQRAIELAVDVAVQFDLMPQAVQLLERAILLLLDQRHEEKATRLYEVHAHPRGSTFRAADRLRLLSALTRCETPEALLNVLLLLDDVVKREWELIKQPDLEAALADLRHVEYLLRLVEHPFARPLEERLTAQRMVADRDDETKSTASPLAGAVVVLLGGRASTREHAARQLKLDHHVADVRAIPPSWEATFDRESVRAKLQRADFVAEITDCIKHDALAIIRSLQGGELAFEHVPTRGGPTHIIRDLVASATKRQQSA